MLRATTECFNRPESISHGEKKKVNADPAYDLGNKNLLGRYHQREREGRRRERDEKGGQREIHKHFKHNSPINVC